MNRTVDKKKQSTSPMLDVDRLVLAKRIARHAPPIQTDPDSARLVLIRMALKRLLGEEGT